MPDTSSFVQCAPNPPYDYYRLFYRLLKIQPTLAFELAGLEVPEPSGYGFISSSSAGQNQA